MPCTISAKGTDGFTLKKRGHKCGGRRSCISFLGSPSRPPKVSLGLLGVKNQAEPDRIIYHSHTGAMGAYKILKGHCSQFFIFLNNSFFLNKRKNKLKQRNLCVFYQNCLL